MSSNAPEAPNVSNRVLHRFNLIILDDADQNSVKHIFRSITDLILSSWPSSM
jgi:hypothetical protein